MTERELGLILAKLGTLEEKVIDLTSLIRDNDHRIDKLERFRSWVSGVGFVAAGILATVNKYLYDLVVGG